MSFRHRGNPGREAELPRRLTTVHDGVLGLGQRRDGALSGRAVDEEVAEEDLRSSSAEGAVLGLVVGLDVDCGIGRLFDHLDLGGLCMSAGHTVALAFGGLDHEEDTAVVGQGLVELEGERLVGADHGRGGWRFHTNEAPRGDHHLAAAGDNPEVQTGEQVGTEILALVPRTERPS